MSIKILKLISGEEILAEIVNTTQENTYVKNPVQIVISVPKTVDAQGVQTPLIAFSPWVFLMYTGLSKLAETSLPIKTQHIMFDVDASGQIEEEYKKIFAKVVLPKTSLIIP